MLSLSPATRVFLAVQPIDGRKGFNGLYSLVKATLQQEPTSGFLFVFLTKRRNRLKILTYDGSGLWLLTNSLVSHCPVEALCNVALPASPVVSGGPHGTGSDRSAIGHARGAIAG